MNELNEMTLRESQIAALNILKKVIDICERIDIQYWAVFGTLIGAIRHKGFIPWDDDLDIAMKVDDYNKFIDYFQAHKDELYPLVLHNKDTAGNCFYNITRICDESYFLDFYNYNYSSGAFIDLYPFEGMGGENQISYWNKKFKKMLIYKRLINMSCSKSLLYGNGIIHKIINFPLCIYAKSRGNQYFLEKLELYPKFEWKSSEFVGIPRWEPYLYKNYYQEFVETTFENIKIRIPKKYKEVLEESYGDYMKFPPENERIPHHAYKAYKKG